MQSNKMNFANIVVAYSTIASVKIKIERTKRITVVKKIQALFKARQFCFKIKFILCWLCSYLSVLGALKLGPPLANVLHALHNLSKKYLVFFYTLTNAKSIYFIWMQLDHPLMTSSKFYGILTPSPTVVQKSEFCANSLNWTTPILKQGVFK